VIQRGVNKGAIFVDDIDRQLFLHLLHGAFLKHRVALHAYVLMDNHIHLLATPSTQRGLADAMRMQGNNYVQAFNQRHGRTGPLWQGRFHSSMIDSDAYLLSVYRYIERNPVRAGAVSAEDHPWSSVHGNLQRRDDPMLTPHPAFRALAATARNRTTVYARFLRDVNASADLPAIRSHSARQRPLGGCLPADGGADARAPCGDANGAPAQGGDGRGRNDLILRPLFGQPEMARRSLW
jgi:putative transposase